MDGARVDDDACSLFARCTRGGVGMILLEDNVVNIGRTDGIECLIHVRKNVSREIVVRVDAAKVACCLEA